MVGTDTARELSGLIEDRRNPSRSYPQFNRLESIEKEKDFFLLYLQGEDYA
jgi:hypothetical protein